MAKLKDISKLPTGMWPGFLLTFVPALAAQAADGKGASLLWMTPGNKKKKDSLVVFSSDGHFLVRAEVSGVGYAPDLPKGGCIYHTKDLLKIARLPVFSIVEGEVRAEDHTASPRQNADVPEVACILAPPEAPPASWWGVAIPEAAALLNGMEAMVNGFTGKIKGGMKTRASAAVFPRPGLQRRQPGQLYLQAEVAGRVSLRIDATLMTQIGKVE